MCLFNCFLARPLTLSHLFVEYSLTKIVCALPCFFRKTTHYGVSVFCKNMGRTVLLLSASCLCIPSLSPSLALFFVLFKPSMLSIDDSHWRVQQCYRLRIVFRHSRDSLFRSVFCLRSDALFTPHTLSCSCTCVGESGSVKLILCLCHVVELFPFRHH